MRMVIVRNSNNSISCIPVSKNKQYYLDKYNVITFVNKLHNPYYITRIKKYFESHER